MVDDLLIPFVEARQREQVPGDVIKNMVKERLQYPVLEYVYGSKEFQRLAFHGGSCLRICFDGSRLSEDLDFAMLSGTPAVDLEILAKGLEERFGSQFLLPVEAKIQQSETIKRVTLKFPILKKLGLAPDLSSESELLHVKIEINRSSFGDRATSDSLLETHALTGIETSSVVKFGFSFLVKHYTLPLLMTGKIHALLTRVWFKGVGSEVDIKGRDFFDLFWYFDRKIEPDWEILEQVIGISTMDELKKTLWQKIEQSVTSEKLVYDLKHFFSNQVFVSDFCKHYKEIMRKYLQ